ncbi:hypothetical protein [Sphingobacterium sp. UBA6320]|nr:hypothetical protein [Sphingobacterium sp. UBA6320]
MSIQPICTEECVLDQLMLSVPKEKTWNSLRFFACKLKLVQLS